MTTIDAYLAIPLSNGGFAIIDEADAGRVEGFTWFRKRMRGIWYAHTSVRLGPKSRDIRMHRYLFGLGPDDRRIEVDHRNHDGLDNRRCNLRLATQPQNSTNRRKWGKASRFKGVTLCPDGRRWQAKIRLTSGGVRKDLALGRFETEAEAAFAYGVAAPLMRDPEFLCLVPIPEEELPSPERQAEISGLVLAKIKELLAGRKGRLGATSKYHGVNLVRSTGRWFAKVRFDDAPRFVGSYATEIEAAFAHDYAVERLGIGNGKLNGVLPEELPQAVGEIRGEVDRLTARFLNEGGPMEK